MQAHPLYSLAGIVLVSFKANYLVTESNIWSLKSETERSAYRVFLWLSLSVQPQRFLPITGFPAAAAAIGGGEQRLNSTPDPGYMCARTRDDLTMVFRRGGAGKSESSGINDLAGRSWSWGFSSSNQWGIPFLKSSNWQGENMWPFSESLNWWT